MSTSENPIWDKKKFHLCNTIYTTTGRVLDLVVPLYANQNDAEIIKNLIEDPHGLCQLLNEGDKLFLDCGFRDAKDQKRKDLENTLANEAQEKGWFCKKLMFQSFSSNNLLDFPELTERNLKILFTGLYQLLQAVSYLAEMMNDNMGPSIYNL